MKLYSSQIQEVRGINRPRNLCAITRAVLR